MTHTPDPIDVQVGAAIRSFRLNVGMTQAALGDAIGVQFQQIQKYETAHNRISASRLKHAADALGVSVKDFFQGTEDGADQGRIAAVIADRQALEIACAIHKLRPEVRHGIMNVIAAINT